MGKTALQYSGQSSDDLLAHQKTHRRDAILFCLADALGEKAKRGQALTPQEQVVRSLIAMHRAVWERGFGKFFREAGQEVPALLANLKKIGALQMAELASQAFASRRRAAALRECDEDYFASNETEARLWAYVLKHRKEIQVPAFDGLQPAGQEFPSTPIQHLWWRLEDAGFRRKETIEACRARALRLAEKHQLDASEQDLEGAVLWFLLANWVEEGRLDACAAIGDRALELAGGELASEVLSWVEQLLEEEQFTEADRWATAFLNHAAGDPRPWAPVDFELWQDLLRKQRRRLPNAVKRTPSRSRASALPA